MSDSIKRYSLSKQVSDELEKMIENGEYEVGSKIPTEVELMEMFDVSRNTIREAIQSLNSAGILVVKQGDGTYVKSNNRFNGCMNLKYEQVSVDDINEARNTLEVTIAHLAAQRRTQEDIENIKKALIERKELKNTIRENTIADMNFHIEIAKACHNTILCDFYKSIASFIAERIIKRNVEADLDYEFIDKLHEELYNAISDKNPAKASICVENILKI